MGHLIFFFSVHAHFSCLTTCMFVGADVRVGRCVCVCLQNSTPYIHHTICPLPLQAGARQLRRGNGHEQLSTHPHGISSITRQIEIRFASPPYDAHPTHPHEIIPSCCRCDTESMPIYAHTCVCISMRIHAYICMHVCTYIYM